MDSSDCKQYWQAQFLLNALCQLLIHYGAPKKRQSTCRGQSAFIPFLWEITRLWGVSVPAPFSLSVTLQTVLSPYTISTFSRKATHPSFVNCSHEQSGFSILSDMGNQRKKCIIHPWRKGSSRTLCWTCSSERWVLSLCFLQKNMTISKSVLTQKTDYGIQMV